MKILKYIFFLLLALIVIGSIYLATLDGSYDVKRSRVIQAEPEVVFNDLNDYKNWAEWGPWYEQDTTIAATYANNTVGEGGSYSWTGKEGGGTMNTLKVDKPKSLDQEIIFNTPFGDMRSDVYWKLEKVKEGTNLTWGMKGEMGFFSRFMASGMEDQIGPMEERGLELFDKNLLKKTKVFSIETNGVVDYSGGYYLYTTASCKIEEIDSKYPVLLLKIYGFNKTNNIRTKGGPFTLYHKYDEENGTAMFSVCYPVAEKMITPSGSDILSGFMESGKYFKTTLKGSYENSDEAWKTAMKEVENIEGYSMNENGEPFEVYGNNPHDTPNPADLITEIYVPVNEVQVMEE
ncbi:MAG: SRPBCC family protein [Flavobacteriaceae bacterium]|nr:SRPBCC family protein [Flavobacteriaceae bacterium]